MEQVIGVIATLCTIISYVPQAVMALRTRNTSGLSWGLAILSFCGAVFWTIYGIMRHESPIIVTNGLVMLPTAYMLYAKIRDTARPPSNAELLKEAA